MSSESVAECIQLTDEIRLLPENHKAKVDKIEVNCIIMFLLLLLLFPIPLFFYEIQA